ncbi:Protein LEG1 -like protein [Collichthys lucidus]|uniref:Protein LEG1-like protein n=1 Tax=Collichthys lucidus TaxID=240159 RepID=A0A4U5UNQ4_COLLU|nr:Protein LEG1 -like protein [Collichthys lucidus]
MLRPTVLSLLLACAVSLGSSTVILENGMPLMWGQAWGQVTDLPTQNGILNPDPWNVLHRMSLYRLMISATDSYMGCMGTNATDNPIWGLPLQLGWMKTSGRLADPTSTTTCGLQTGDPMCISTQSWWGCVNYFTSALPFLSAAKQGFMGEGVQGLKSAKDSPLPDNEKKDSLLGLYWAAQMVSTHTSAICNARKSHYSSVEVSFAQNWVNSAEYVSAAHFHSNLNNSARFLTPLPSRVLKVDDSPPNIADLSEDENHTLSIFSWMSKINTLLGGSLVRMWKRAMCSVTTREKGRELLNQLLLDPRFATTSFLSIISGMTTSC